VISRYLRVWASLFWEVERAGVVPANNVVKDYNRNLLCGEGPNHVIAAVEGNFAQFGNFTTTGPLGGLLGVSR
jgi:hypothetical protein